MRIFCLRHGSHILSGLRCLLCCIVAEKNHHRKCATCYPADHGYLFSRGLQGACKALGGCGLSPPSSPPPAAGGGARAKNPEELLTTFYMSMNDLVRNWHRLWPETLPMNAL